jgi:N-ethylmaleimide reductase
VTDAVHAAGGAIFVQLMHTGRASHQANLPPAPAWSPSAVRLASDIWVDPDGNRPASEPIAMTEADIDHALTSYADASALAIEAGFDGVELHAANGYLIDQFLNTASNQRTDAWGGSIANRIRFAVEAARRSAARIGGDRVGIRVSPYGVFNGMRPIPSTRRCTRAGQRAVGARPGLRPRRRSQRDGRAAGDRHGQGDAARELRRAR